jgi:hypothetical protein
LDQLSNKTVEDNLTERLHDVTLATVSKELVVLKSAHARALRWDWVSTTPFRGIALNQEGEERVRWLTDDEETWLVTGAAPWLRDIILVGLDTGLRRSNLVGLQWSWLHEQGTILVVPRQLVKAKKATVMIPLTSRAALIIQRQRRHGPRVFTHPDGHAYSLDQVGEGRHSHSETGAVVRSESAYAPAYLHQPTGAGRTTTPRGGGAGRTSRYQDDAALCAPGTQSSTGWDSGVGAANSPSPGRTRVIHRTACHAGVTGLCRNRVSAGGPNGI